MGWPTVLVLAVVGAVLWTLATWFLYAPVMFFSA